MLRSQAEKAESSTEGTQKEITSLKAQLAAVKADNAKLKTQVAPAATVASRRRQVLLAALPVQKEPPQAQTPTKDAKESKEGNTSVLGPRLSSEREVEQKLSRDPVEGTSSIGIAQRLELKSQQLEIKIRELKTELERERQKSGPETV